MASQEIFEFRGVDGLVYAEVVSDTKDGITFGMVKPLSPVAEVGKSTDSSSESHYYDNQPKIVISSTNADNLTLTVAPLDLPTLAEITGQDYISELGAIVEGERTEKYFAIGYKTKGTDGKYRYVWRYKGLFAIPDETNATEDDSTATNNTQLTWTGVMTNYKFRATKKPAKSMVCDERLAVVDFGTFFDEVKTPDNTTGAVMRPMPVTFSPESGTNFKDSLTVKLSSVTPYATIKYKFREDADFTEYTGPVTITETNTIIAVSYIEGSGESDSTPRTATYTKSSE